MNSETPQISEELVSAPALTSRIRFFTSELRILPGVVIPLHSMLVETPTKAVLVSPVGTQAELAACEGKQTILVEPSLLHHKRLAKAMQRLEPTELWGPEGFADKLPEFKDARVFGRDPWPHDDVLSFALIAGVPKRNEVVFFHHPSRTLYTADLAFAIMEPKGMIAPMALRAMGIYKRFGVAKMWKSWVEDKAAFQASIDRVLAWPFERIALAHGDIVEGNARQKLFAALRERELV
ncbi:MAG TPA: hypothetical protein VFQ65_25675 [Kofleriaceae bacterium]|nr:hypothetical protein [Kofleriaceae bacterium]